LEVPANVMPLHLPALSPKLNPVERVWGYLRSHHLSNRVYRDYDELFHETTIAWNLLPDSRLQGRTATGWLRRAVLTQGV
jgi:transposase